MAAARTGASVAPGLNDHGLNRRDLHHLACAQQPTAILGQVGAAAVAGGGAALDDGIRGLAGATCTRVAGLGAALLLRLGARAIGLASLGGSNRGVRGVFRGLGEALDLLLQLGDGGLKLRDEGLLLKDDLDELGLGQLLQLLEGHGGGSWSDEGCERAAVDYGLSILRATRKRKADPRIV